WTAAPQTDSRTRGFQHASTPTGRPCSHVARRALAFLHRRCALGWAPPRGAAADRSRARSAPGALRLPLLRLGSRRLRDLARAGGAPPPRSWRRDLSGEGGPADGRALYGAGGRAGRTVPSLER